ncbi:FAD/NAD-binding domain-containing protein [Panus rudis PR-1116 ss-1]|nr:FAD/NAD-binding domain-containing protein [Panus rudis PR-1116 ss-1]
MSQRTGSFSIDEYRPMKVIIIGSGFSGITAGIRFRQRVPNLDLVIYDKNEGIGGTWFTNKYPCLLHGLTILYRFRAASFQYQLSFEYKVMFYAPGSEILSYMQGIVDKYKLEPYIKLEHEVVHARWNEPSGKWHVRIRRPMMLPNGEIKYEEFEDTADMLFSGTGALSRWNWPDIKGLKDYQGTLVHGAHWDVDADTWKEGWQDKTVAVIGVGSSAIQMVPSLQPRVAKLLNYVRGKAWLTPSWAGDKMADLLNRDPELQNFTFTEDEIKAFKDPEYYRQFRHELESELNSIHLNSLRGSPMQLGAKKAFKESMIQRLAKKPWIADHLIPEFGVGCRRLTPGPGYLEALCEDNVEFITQHIKRFTKDGIETIDGDVQNVDVIICATGYDTTFRSPFPIIGRNNTDLRDKWSPHPETYLSICVDEFPNYFFSLGPNSGVGSGSLLAVIEQEVDYAVEATLKLQRERLKSIEVKREAVEDFDKCIENYFPTTVYSERCRSWYKMGKEEGRIVGLWPGSCLHALRALKHPRWEDYNYERIDKMKNRFYWLGDGSTYNEKHMTGDRAWYLNDVDFPPGTNPMCSRSAPHTCGSPPEKHAVVAHFRWYIRTDGDVADSVPFSLGSFSIDEYRPMKVIIIGTGFSGITAGIRFRQRVPNLDMVIYEKNEGIGGTWFANRYPGLACDIPAHCYQLTFEPKTDWSAFYAPGSEILSYLEGVVDKYKLKPYIKLQHELVHAQWDEPTGRWHVRIKRPVSLPNGEINSEEFEDSADMLFSGTGGLSRWNWPDIEGIKDYQGTLLHSAHWDVDEETWKEGWKDKTVAVIGVGSSAIQIVPALQPRVAKVLNYVRGKTWLSPPFAADKMADLLKRDPGSQNFKFTEDDHKAFEDPEYYKQFRHDLESELNSVHLSTLRGTPMQLGAKKAFKESMIQRLAKKPWIADHLVPEFGVACRRLTPGPGYLEALCEDNVDFITQHIKRFTRDGIETVDGEFQKVDVIVCATGYDTTFLSPFPIIGRNHKDLRDKWSPHPETYLSICVDEFPNYFFSLGPNSGVGSGSLLAVIEQEVDYAVEATLKLQRERLKSIEVKREAVDDYDEYIESVYSEKCRSWYKMGKEEGRVILSGSCLHALRALKHPRWEDYNYERIDKVKNRLYWLGDGSTYNEKHMTGDRK